MNTFFLFFLPLTWTLAKENKTVQPFTVHSTVNLSKGHKYNADKVDGPDTGNIVFVSNDTAYSFIFLTDKLIEHNRQGTSFKSTVVANSNRQISSIAVGNNNDIFVSWFKWDFTYEAVNSTLSIYKDSVFTMVHEFDGILSAFDINHDKTKIYGQRKES
ncbi:hypothetical protein DSO57_1020691 [Entomophthora muscae]|uniref:Uncharacterized protein n=1 Tax=Entomophthora muscae TaxID=34485 RepID=A0ACC2U2Q8_9FUNG|nr:hypothetical protein DSO57_1020691 [Entomophthora muscae]